MEKSVAMIFAFTLCLEKTHDDSDDDCAPDAKKLGLHPKLKVSMDMHRDGDEKQNYK